MIARGHGHMVFVSSLAGKAASAASSIYSATKFGLRGFALALRTDLEPHGVGVSTVLPGFIRDAGMFAEASVTLPARCRARARLSRSPSAVIKAIESDRAEVDVAPLPLRLGATFAGVAPGLSAKVSRRLGSEQIATDLAAGQAEQALPDVGRRPGGVCPARRGVSPNVRRPARARHGREVGPRTRPGAASLRGWMRKAIYFIGFLIHPLPLAIAGPGAPAGRRGARLAAGRRPGWPPPGAPAGRSGRPGWPQAARPAGPARPG